MDPIILHADLNGFFASVELLTHPELRDVPMAVAGDAELRHGIILAKNEKAKAFGIQTAETIWQAKKKCPSLHLVAPDLEKYHHYSQQARSIFCRLTDRVEPFGLDEAWLDVTGSTGLFGDGQAMADRLRRWTREELGLTCSVGVSFTKAFAKLGSDLHKPDATTVISRENYRQLVWPLPVSQLLYVGATTARQLNRFGVRTIGDLAACDEKLLRQWLGRSGGALWMEACGLSDAKVEQYAVTHPVKSIGNSTTTAQDLTNAEQVKAVLFRLSDQVAARLRAGGLKAKTLQITIRDSAFVDIDRQTRLNPPTDLAADLAPAAAALFQKHYSWHRPVRNLGVRATDLVGEDEARQISLDDWQKTDKERAKQHLLEQTVDQLRIKFGSRKISRGLLLNKQTPAVDDAVDENQEITE